MALLIKKSTFCQKVTVHKDQKIPFISNLKKPACASKQDVLELMTLRYIIQLLQKLKKILDILENGK